MLSIGVLGFIVWSQIMMALHYCEIVVINFAICLKYKVKQIYNKLLLTLCYKQETFNNKYSLTLLRGLYKFYDGSSETTSKRSYNSNSYKNLEGLKYLQNTNEEWLNWFIGFSEGDGAILTYKKRAIFVLTQKEGKILYEIKNKLGFGKIRKEKNFYRYIVEDNTNIKNLITIFNGKLIMPKRVEQFNKWLELFDIDSKFNSIKTIDNISLNNAWLSGFTDAEGCFNIQVLKRNNTKNGHRIILRYILDQKDEKLVLERISTLFNCSTSTVYCRNKIGNYYRLTINSFNRIQKIIEYYDKFPLKTQKSNSYAIWIYIYMMTLKKEHLTLDGLNKIKLLKEELVINNKKSSSVKIEIFK